MTSRPLLRIASADAMAELGAHLARVLPDRAIIYLIGDLGAGKTTLVRGLIHAFAPGIKVKSPTFTLVEPYEGLPQPVYHFDLYRLADPEELDFIGARDYFDSASWCLVEWPEKGGAALPEPDLEIVIAHAGEERRVELRARTATGQAILQGLAERGGMAMG